MTDSGVKHYHQGTLRSIFNFQCTYSGASTRLQINQQNLKLCMTFIRRWADCDGNHNRGDIFKRGISWIELHHLIEMVKWLIFSVYFTLHMQLLRTKWFVRFIWLFKTPTFRWKEPCLSQLILNPHYISKIWYWVDES